MADPNNNTHIDHLELDPADGQQYIVELRDRLIDLLSPYQMIEDVEERIRKLYPDSKLVDLAIREAKKSRTETLKIHKSRHHSSSSSSASFAIEALHKISRFLPNVSNLIREGFGLVEGVVGNKNENEVTKFKMAFIEFIIDDVLNLAGDFVKRQKNNFIITRSDIRTAMHADKDLLDMFLSDDKSLIIMENHPILAHISCTEAKSGIHHNQHLSTLTYKQKVRNMVDSENSFIRRVKLIIKVFKAQMEKIPRIKREVEIIFCNIEELLELSILLLTAFEDALESVGPEEDEVPFVGSEIFDLAQAEEFQAYFNFAYKRLSNEEHWRQAYQKVISDETTMSLIKTAGQSIRLPGNSDPMKFESFQQFDLAVKHILPNYLLNTIIQFFKYYENFCDLFELSKKHSSRDDELALKETISILIKTKKAIEELVKNKLDLKEIDPLDSKHADTETIRLILEKELDAELQRERNLPLAFMPPPEIYIFSEPDSKDNIQFEDFSNHSTIDRQLRHMDIHGVDINANKDNKVPVIRCATLIKLVERLTYHKYQPTIVESFLTTYRSFISDPEELLDLLIVRFKIPDPPLSVVFPNFVGQLGDLPENDLTTYKHYLKRFRQEYSKPVKMRVINVLKSWIKYHYYDFERHPTLLNKLNVFLDDIYTNDKVLRSLSIAIKKQIEQKQIEQKQITPKQVDIMLSKEPPKIVWHTAKSNEPEKFDLLSLHPVEFARQLTLFEFDLFRAIKPSELINVRDLGLRTRKEDKYESSPNLSRMTRHFTLLSYWIRKCIVEADDIDKRAAIYNRAIEIMAVLRELNNFTGLLSIGSAIESAPIVRLPHTRKTLTNTTRVIMDDYRKLNADHQKELQQQLRKCNPPCIPYLGSYQTKLIHAKEGNRTFIDEVDTTSPTLSNDEFHSSFSNSPATPISPRTPLPRTTTSNLHSATSTMQNQFFGGCGLSRPLPINLGNCNNNNNNHSHNGNMSPPSSNLILQQTPLTPGPPKMINFTKQRIRAGLVAEIGNYQNPPYCLKMEPNIKQFIENIEYEMTNFVAKLTNSNSQHNKNHPHLGNINAGDSDSSIENSVPAMTKRLDDYLFEQSKKIEPKDSTKPLRSKSKLPEAWKSPGIKV